MIAQRRLRFSQMVPMASQRGLRASQRGPVARGMDVKTDIQTYGRLNILSILNDFVPY